MNIDTTRDTTPISIEVELPKWLCDRAEQAGIELGNVLTEALQKHLERFLKVRELGLFQQNETGSKVDKGQKGRC